MIADTAASRSRGTTHRSSHEPNRGRSLSLDTAHAPTPATTMMVNHTHTCTAPRSRHPMAVPTTIGTSAAVTNVIQRVRVTVPAMANAIASMANSTNHVR